MQQCRSLEPWGRPTDSPGISKDFVPLTVELPPTTRLCHPANKKKVRGNGYFGFHLFIPACGFNILTSTCHLYYSRTTQFMM